VVFSVEAKYDLAGGYIYFGGIYRLHLQCEIAYALRKLHNKVLHTDDGLLGCRAV
jgi:hypothetical protein